MATLSPVFRTPLTDLTGNLATHQSGKRCADFEMRAMECLEAYGVQKGKTICVDYMDDLRECMFQHKQLSRVHTMRVERHRQYYLGDAKEHYAPAAKVPGY